MRVLKFGGSSVAGPEAIAATYKIVAQSETPLLVVVSALGGVTDLLLGCHAPCGFTTRRVAGVPRGHRENDIWIPFAVCSP